MKASTIPFLILAVCLPALSQNWNLIWSDEFNTDGPVDTTHWRFETGTGASGWGNNELQFCTSRPENACVRGGDRRPDRALHRALA
ncbi:MAG: hypothetical protein JXA71_02800 [Chitinispirillaceae bacterium]|nr:hypothetical protein [Chitinispirillaceae bacterium]